MNWDRVNIWTCTLYTLIHSLHLAREQAFGDLLSFDLRARESGSWIQPDCSYASVLLDHPSGGKSIRMRRDPNVYFNDVTRHVVKMLVQDLVVILDQMMDEALAARNERAGSYPQSKVERLQKGLASEYRWAAQGCLELIAIRNVLEHADGRWNERSIFIIQTFVKKPPAVGEPLSVGCTMLFRYRKALRTFLNQLVPPPAAKPKPPKSPTRAKAIR